MYAKFSFLSFLARARPLGSILIQLFPKPGENPVLDIYSRGRGRIWPKMPGFCRGRGPGRSLPIPYISEIESEESGEKQMM